MLAHVGDLLECVGVLQKAASERKLTHQQQKLLDHVDRWYVPTSKVVSTAFRRTQLRETVPNEDTIFSSFETHTQLYRRGKAGEPNQFGRLVFVFEDAVGFISHHYLMGRNEMDCDVVVADENSPTQTRRRD